MNNLPMSVLATLPLYTDGVAAGRDLGLVIALNAITLERNQLADDIIASQATDPDRAAVFVYADGRLLELARRLAAVFRQATP